MRAYHFVLLSALLAAGCTSRGCVCHTGHNEVQFHKAYETHHSTCIMRDQRGNCTASVPRTEYHPARCDVSWVCDLSCKAVDQGRAEAHPDHPTLSTKVDNRSQYECTDEGGLRR